MIASPYPDVIYTHTFLNCCTSSHKIPFWTKGIIATSNFSTLQILTYRVQDQVPPFPSETALAIVEEELGAPVRDIFDQFDYEKTIIIIIMSSIYFIAGQVHHARLKGQEIVTKVQRPGLKGLFDIDLKNLRVSVISLSYDLPSGDTCISDVSLW